MAPKTSVRTPIFIDAFAGCGGLSLGLLQAGCRGLFAVEHDALAFATLKANLVDGRGPLKFNWPTWCRRDGRARSRKGKKRRQPCEVLARSERRAQVIDCVGRKGFAIRSAHGDCKCLASVQP
jgi:site-specific DNA-cytosine methylase